MRLIDADALWTDIMMLPHNGDMISIEEVEQAIKDAPAVDAVILPHPPRPMLKDSNPYNTDVYCPECGTNLSGYYGGESLPLVTCFNCGEILDPFKAVTKMDGREGNES